jgi:hypothetical protein
MNAMRESSCSSYKDSSNLPILKLKMVLSSFMMGSIRCVDLRDPNSLVDRNRESPSLER